MELNDEEVKKLPKGDALCLMAYVKSVEAVKEYQAKMDKHHNPKHLSYNILKLVKETHENYGNILLNILAEMPTIKDAMIIKNPPIKNTKSKMKN